MPGRIFVNYRRDDERAMAARIRDRLAQAFGNANVFMDVDNLIAGQRFDRELEKALVETDVFLTVLGPKWMSIFQSRLESGERDYVREEIAGALKRGIVVIPVVVEGCVLPRGSELPDDVRELVLHQKHGVTHEQFGRDVDALIEAIKFVRKVKQREQVSFGSWNRWLAAFVSIVVLASVVAAGWHNELLLSFLRSQSDPSSSKDCTHCPEMVVLPAGRFTMGSPANEIGRETWEKGTESPLTDVAFAKPFAISRYPVTRGEFAEFIDATGYKMGEGCTGMKDGTEWRLHRELSWRSPGFEQDNRHPVVCISWTDATAYVQWLKTITGRSYRIPSEAEREYAARAGTRTAFWWGASIKPDQANYSREISYNGSTTTSRLGRTVAVDTFKPNPWGLYQVHGNVHELTQDCWHANHVGADPNGGPRATTDCAFRTLRSGGWNNHPILLRSAARGKVAQEMRQENMGFRVARDM